MPYCCESRGWIYWAWLLVGTVAVLATGNSACAADNQLTEREKEEGWLLLFDGHTLDGWKAIDGVKTAELFESKRPVEEGTINPHLCGGEHHRAYMLLYEQSFEDFVLKFDLRLGPLSAEHTSINSGVFLRVFPLQPRPGYSIAYNGIEVAVDSTDGTSFTDAGAIHDLARPLLNNIHKPVGDGVSKWNHVIVTNHENLLTVVMNGELLTVCDLDHFAQLGKRRDGSEHKFVFAMKDHPRKGYIGL